MTSPRLDATLVSRHASETEHGQRYGFGENWRRYLRTVDEQRIAVAMESLKAMLGMNSLEGKTFIDIGSGSGLFSLAAYRLGADVTSFDYDPDSVACTGEMRERYASGSARWQVLHGSVLDKSFMDTLGTYDIVYSWGVLHHTGDMWRAIYNVLPLVAPDGRLFIALYNDQGVWSHRWRKIKQVYCSGTPGKLAVSGLFMPAWALRIVASDVLRLRAPWHSLVSYRQSRGMSVWHDWCDWLGGYPFEVAKPEAVILALQKRGFALDNLNTQYGTVGNVEYVFRRTE